VWGVPIPALYHLPTDRAVMDNTSLSHILRVLEEKGTSHWWDGPVSDFIPESMRVDGEDVEATWKKGTDTMDVWFDSGSSWSMLRDLEGQEDRKHYADVCVEGSDQHRGWFQSQLLTGVSVHAGTSRAGVSPYKTLVTHGMVLDESGKKMSKSDGNIISPITVIEGGENKKKDRAYGAEVLRLWAATVEFWKDMSLGPRVLAQTAEALRKIRNSARFMLGNIGDEVSRKDFVPVSKAEMSLVGSRLSYVAQSLTQVTGGQIRDA
jgi:isoleucyl-tRNA synthetase